MKNRRSTDGQFGVKIIRPFRVSIAEMLSGLRKRTSSVLERMKGYSRAIGILIRTSLLVSNRDTANAFISYLAYALGGLGFSVMALIPVMDSASAAAAKSPFVFLAFVMMFDYINVQTLLGRVTLIDKSPFSPFPVSPVRSGIVRFILMLLDKRLLFYLVPMVVVLSAVLSRGFLAEAAATVALYSLVYLVTSEILFGLLPLFRALSARFGARTTRQIALLPLLFVLFFPGLFQMKQELVLRIPVAGEFVSGSKLIFAGELGGAMVQTGRLLLTTLVLGAVLIISGLLLSRIGPAILSSVAPEVSGGDNASDAGRLPVPRPLILTSAEVPVDSTVPRTPSRTLSLFRIAFLDWKIRQREEKILFVILITPSLALLPALSRPIASVIFPIFIVSQMVGLPLVENNLVQRGLRLKHISALPADPTRFVRAKFFSVWIPMVGVNFAVTVALGLRWGITYYQATQGIMYSMFIPMVLILINDALTLIFSSISRHPFISALILLIVEIIATLAYVLSMVFNVAAGIVFVAGPFAFAYFRRMPDWGRRIEAEFQTILEESK